jgi:cold-inducible RNA-binding protein
MGTRLFVGNLSYNVNEQELKEAFTGEGIEVRSVRVALDRETGRPRGFAFVETMTDDGAKQSIEKLSGRVLQGRSLIVEEAQARPAPGAPRPGGGPGGPPRTFGPRPGGPGGPPGAGGGFGGPPRPFTPRPPGPGGPGGFAPRPPGPGMGAAGKFPDRPPAGRGDGRRERPEKKRSTRPKAEDRERGNWRWKGTLDED